jgi:hypothetical protein
MKVMVCHFVSDSHEVMTALIVVLPLIVVVEISLQLHRSHVAGRTDSQNSRVQLASCHATDLHNAKCFKTTLSETALTTAFATSSTLTGCARRRIDASG